MSRQKSRRDGTVRALAIAGVCAVALALSRPAAGAGFKSWAAIYGGSGAEEMEGLRETADGGYIVVGSTDSYGDTAAGDAWVVKLDRYGAPEWQNTYGGLGDESLVDVRQTPNGGYVAVGWTKSFGVSKMDFWVVKLSASGAVEWEKAYGGAGKEQAWSVDLTADGGYIVAGGTTSFGAGRADYWVLKLDAAGNIQWQETYGGPKADGGAGAYSEYVVRVLAARDGNYVVASESYSFGSGAADIWVLKLDPNGNILWQYAYGGSDDDSMWTFAETADGGYIVPGSTVTFSPDWSGDTWVLKLASSGAIEWQKVFAVPRDWDEALTVGATADGGAVVGSYVEQGSSDWDLLLFRLDAGGNLQWQRSYEYGWDWPNAIQETADGGLAVGAVGWPRPQDLELLVLRLGPDGLVGSSSCSAIRGLALVEGTTSVSPVPTSAVPQNTAIVPRTTNAIVQSSSATPNFLCQGNPAEDCANGIDDDGDTLVDCADPDCQADADGDSYVAVPCGGDCDDSDPAVNPAATEVCTNGKDDECDGLADCADPDCQTGTDLDGDGYVTLPCGTDCDDTDPAIHPGAAEVCTNGKDDDCDGALDCADTDCMPLATCTLATDFARGRSMVRFNRRTASRDQARMRLCVTGDFCGALAVLAGDPAKTLSATLAGCSPVTVSGEAVSTNRKGTVFKAKSARGVKPGYVLRVACRKLEAQVRLKQTDLRSCATNPLPVTLSADGTRSLRAEATFTEKRDGNGNLRRLLLKTSHSCTP